MRQDGEAADCKAQAKLTSMNHKSRSLAAAVQLVEFNYLENHIRLKEGGMKHDAMKFCIKLFYINSQCSERKLFINLNPPLLHHTSLTDRSSEFGLSKIEMSVLRQT